MGEQKTDCSSISAASAVEEDAASKPALAAQNMDGGDQIGLEPSPLKGHCSVREFWSTNRMYGLRISEADIACLFERCTNSGMRETGGILVGYYEPDHCCAVVSLVIGAPPDSRSGCTWFERGVAGLQASLEKRWLTDRHYYLGEWHFHPGGAPNPSGSDLIQMRRIAMSLEYRCPEPLLLIIGGSAAGGYRLGATVVLRKGAVLNLIEVSNPNPVKSE